MQQKVTVRRSGESSFLPWFGLSGGGLAWFVHLTASYLLSESVCAAPFARVELPGLPGVPGSLLLHLAVTLVLGLAALGATIAGYRSWSVRQHETALGSAGFVGLAGFILSGTFLFIIIIQTLPVLFLGGCQRL
jgi:hypothetical protein